MTDMKPWPVYNIPIKDIEVGERLRPLDPKEVDKKVESIREVGLLQAITVSAHPTEKNETGEPVYVLQAGLHRLEAYKAMDMETIPAHVTTLEGVRARLVEVDENLCRAELDQAMRAKFTARRKEIYEELHPEAKQGAAQGAGMKRSAAGPDSENRSQVDNQPSNNKTPSFVDDTAATTGRSPSTIALDAERGSKIAGDVLDEVAGTPLAKGKVLDELKDLPQEQQRKRMEELKKEEQKKRESKTKTKQTKSKGKSLPKSTEPLEHKSAPAKDLTTQLEPCFKALWQLSVDLKKSEVRDWADKIERALEKKGYVPTSERLRDSKGYLARLKPKANAELADNAEKELAAPAIAA